VVSPWAVSIGEDDPGGRGPSRASSPGALLLVDPCLPSRSCLLGCTTFAPVEQVEDVDDDGDDVFDFFEMRDDLMHARLCVKRAMAFSSYPSPALSRQTPLLFNLIAFRKLQEKKHLSFSVALVVWCTTPAS